MQKINKVPEEIKLDGWKKEANVKEKEVLAQSFLQDWHQFSFSFFFLLHKSKHKYHAKN